MKKLIIIGILFQTFNIFGQERTFQTKANDLIQKSVNENQTIGIVAGFCINGDRPIDLVHKIVNRLRSSHFS